MRHFELSTSIPADQDTTWQTLARLPEWSAWNRLVPHAEGELRPGTRLELKMRGPGGRPGRFRPTVVSVNPPVELVLAASVGSRQLLHMVHSLTVEAVGPAASLLTQRWNATGFLVPLLWPLIRRGMARFAEFGSDLALRVSTSKQDGAAQPAIAATGAGPPG